MIKLIYRIFRCHLRRFVRSRLKSSTIDRDSCVESLIESPRGGASPFAHQRAALNAMLSFKVLVRFYSAPPGAGKLPYSRYFEHEYKVFAHGPQSGQAQIRGDRRVCGQTEAIDRVTRANDDRRNSTRLPSSQSGRCYSSVVTSPTTLVHPLSHLGLPEHQPGWESCRACESSGGEQGWVRGRSTRGTAGRWKGTRRRVASASVRWG